MSRVPQLLRDNLALTLGIALPVLLMVGFVVAGRMTMAATDPPQFDAVFAVNYDERWANQPWRLDVVDQALVIRFDPPDGAEAPALIKPTVYLWDHEAMTATLVDIDFDRVVGGAVQDPALDRLNTRRLLDEPESPDGYRLEYDTRRRSGLFGDLIGLYRYRPAYSFTKDSRRIAVEGPEPYYQVHFIAWIQE